MSGLDYKDLDQWMVDLDVLQNELRTIQSSQNRPVSKEKVNGWSSTASTHTNPNQYMFCSASTPGVNRNATMARVELRHPTMRPAEIKQRSKSEQLQSRESVLRNSAYATENGHNIYEPIGLNSSYEHGFRVSSNADALHYKPHAPLTDRRNGHTGRAGGPSREQKSVHWSSELNSSPSSPTIHGSTISQRPDPKSRPTSMNAVDVPIQLEKQNIQRVSYRQSGRTTSSERSYKPLQSTHVIPLRRDIMVERSHSLKPFNRTPVRSVTVPSNLAFPMTLADLATQSPTNRTCKEQSQNCHSPQSPGFAFIPIPVTMMANHTNSITEAPFSQSGLSPQLRAGLGMTRSQSAMTQLPNHKQSDGFLINSGSLNYEPVGIPNRRLQPPQNHSSGIHSPIRVQDEPRSSGGWDSSILDLNPYGTLEETSKKRIDRLILRVYHPNRTTKAVSVGVDTTALNVIETLLEKNNRSWSSKYALVEKIPSMKLERCFEDNELIMDCLGNWTMGCENLVFFEEREDMYGMFENAQLWLGDKIASSMSSNGTSVIKEFFVRNSELNLPSVSEYLYVRSNDGDWKRRFCVLRNSGLYMSKNGSSSIAAFQRLVAFKPYLHLYTTTGGWSKMRAPTPYGFTIKPCSSKVLEAQFTVHFCTSSESSLRMWYSLIRIALVGEDLVRNYNTRQKRSHPLGVSNGKTTTTLSNFLVDYHKSTGDRCTNRYPRQRTNQPSSTTCISIPVLTGTRPESTSTRLSQLPFLDPGKVHPTSTDSQPATVSPDPDATTGDASSIGWSTSGSGYGPGGTPNSGGPTGTAPVNELGCVSGRTDVRPTRHSHSANDLACAADETQTQTNCANSLTSLFSCTMNDKRVGEVGPTSGTGGQPTEKTRMKGRSRSLKKRLFGVGPSARRCSRSVTHISAPFNVSVPSWVRASMHDLSRPESNDNRVQ